MEKILIANKEAIYFNTPNECFKKCLYLLNNEKIIDKIRINGQKKILKILRPEAQNVFKNHSLLVPFWEERSELFASLFCQRSGWKFDDLHGMSTYILIEQ